MRNPNTKNPLNSSIDYSVALLGINVWCFGRHVVCLIVSLLDKDQPIEFVWVVICWHNHCIILCNMFYCLNIGQDGEVEAGLLLGGGTEWQVLMLFFLKIFFWKDDLTPSLEAWILEKLALVVPCGVNNTKEILIAKLSIYGGSNITLTCVHY